MEVGHELKVVLLLGQEGRIGHGVALQGLDEGSLPLEATEQKEASHHGQQEQEAAYALDVVGDV